MKLKRNVVVPSAWHSTQRKRQQNPVRSQNPASFSM
ncbi:unnamed protein product [Echinostoma caproni]|uniref:Single-stranded DNA-binding protein n=1 Tax=Echinostoma caproni TaxID=27848 RepID=A0A183BD42_9TREM|nr:unnamed protein product [Echinostoma caproni]